MRGEPSRKFFHFARNKILYGIAAGPVKHSKKPIDRDTAVLKELPPGFIDDLPAEDQAAIAAIVGKPISLLGYDEDGRAELEFTDKEGIIHFIYVHPRFIGIPK